MCIGLFHPSSQLGNNMLMDIPFDLAPRRGADCLLPRRTIDLIDCAYALWPVLYPLETVYPGFGRWYWDKVLPGLATGQRGLFLIGSASKPKGLAIAKRDHAEPKVCTLWVAPSERGHGLGRELLEEAIEWVGVDRPLFTVPQERYDELLPLTRKLGFHETAQVESLYRAGVVEYIFNGFQSPVLSS